MRNDNPLAPEKIEIKESMLSNYCKEIAKKYNISVGVVKKLVPSLNDQDKYVLHNPNLELHLQFEIRLKTKLNSIRG